MANVFRCPNCDAVLNGASNKVKIKCEYCRSEIILGDSERPAPFQPENRPQPAYDNSEQAKAIRRRYNEEIIEYGIKKKKWFKMTAIFMAVIAALQFLGVLMMTVNLTIGVIMILMSCGGGLILPICCGILKPKSPANVKDVPKLVTVILLYVILSFLNTFVFFWSVALVPLDDMPEDFSSRNSYYTEISDTAQVLK